MNHIETMKQALDALESASPLGATSSSDEQADAAHKKHCDALKALRAAIAQGESEPMFWVRLRSDGLYEGPIHNAQIEKVRKESGGWSPLYLAAPQVADYVPLSDDDIRAEFAKMYASDDSLLRLSENNRDCAVGAIGARQHWTAFKAGARAIERAVRGVK